MVLVFTMLASIANVSFAAEVEQGEIFSYRASAASDITELDYMTENEDKLITFDYAEDVGEESCIPSKDNLLPESLNEPIKVADIDTVEMISEASSANTNLTYSATDFTFNAQLLTSFNNVTGPIAGNGANEPKFSYNSFLEENISDYSGELTLNFEDLVLTGRNGLDLRIGRTYQTVASNIGDKSIMILPSKNGYLRNILVSDYSTYLLDRYNLGMGWGFSFPSVQIETEYIPQETSHTYYYEEESELYYHFGNGEVYRVEFTTDITDSNLKGYYNKDVQFNKNDENYSNGQVTSYYSMTLADKTKQYFAEDGRLIGIVDRFGNTIKFEHELQSITNRVPDGNFRYNDKMWISSTASNGTYDAYPIENASIGSDDGYVMYFRRDNANGESYVMSQPIQVTPLSGYELGIRIKNQYERDVNVEILGYDTAYNLRRTRTYLISDYGTDWYDYERTFSTASDERYIVIKISPENASDTYIDSVTLDEPKPLLKTITDSVGRVITFDYSGDLTTGGSATGAVTITVTSPDGASAKTLTYNKEVIEFATEYLEHDEQRLFWYLNSSSTEGEDGATVKYTYEGGSTTNADGELEYPQLFLRYNTKIHSDSDGWVNKPVLNTIRYKDRKKVYEYETVRKHLGEDGYYDTLRVKKKYDMYSYVPEGATTSSFKGELETVNYTYGGTYNGNTFNNETGYPNYTFDDETALNEKWTVTKTGKTTDSITFSNCAVVRQSRSSDGVAVTSDYTNHSIFKNSPVQIKNTVTEDGVSKETYLLYSYNDWGGVSSETKEIDEEIKNNASLLEKYTTTYQYNDFHNITQKSYYNNIDAPQVHEINTYDQKGRLTKSESSIGEKVNYYYENEVYDFLLTKTVQDDPMGLNNLSKEDRVITYTYDNYACFPVTVSESCGNTAASTSYEYDYISGDVLKETLPDGSYTKYTYYSDGKVKQIIYPLVQYVNGQAFRNIETHTYSTYALHPNYDEENKAFGMDTVRYYSLFSGETTASLYAIEQNLYDAMGNLKANIKYDITKTDENGNYVSYNTRYYHDKYDRLNKSIDADENAIVYSYDGFDRPLTVTDSENNIYTYTYNSVQNKVDLSLNGATELTDRQLITQYFDLYGNVVENVVYPDNSSQTLSESYEYDLNNNVVGYTDANGNKTQYFYDAANRLTKTVLPNNVSATSSYNSFNTPVLEKIYSADGIEKSARISYRNEKGDLKAKFFAYDRHMIDSDIYESDAKGRITVINEGENPKSVIYDQIDNQIVLISGDSQIHRRYNWFGEVWSAATDERITEMLMQYDALGNVTEKLLNNEHSISYAHSAAGKITEATMPSSRTESYIYTANGNLDTITSDGKTFDYDYYDTGYVKSITYPNGLKTTYNYDNINRVTSMTTTKGTTTINTLLYEYDSNGNVVSETRNGAETTYTYDSLDRLLSVTYSDGTSVTYEYDALNNRTKETYSNGDVKDYVYDAKYQLKEIKLNGQVTDTFTYNESGAVVTHNDKTYTYDEWDRMSGFSDGTDIYTYKYDANGIRTQKNDKQYIIDINNNVAAESLNKCQYIHL